MATDSNNHLPGLSRGLRGRTPAPYKMVRAFLIAQTNAYLFPASTPGAAQLRIGHRIREEGMNE